MEIAVAAYAAGARSTTHLFNGMPPLRAREPGPVGAALAAAPFVELITDGIHVDPGLLAPLARAIGDERLLLVSDALPLAGSRLRSIPTPGSSARIVEGDVPSIPTARWPAAVCCSTAWWPAPCATASHSPSPCAPPRRTRRACSAWRTAAGWSPGCRADLVVVSSVGRLRRVLVPAAVSRPSLGMLPRREPPPEALTATCRSRSRGRARGGGGPGSRRPAPARARWFPPPPCDPSRSPCWS